MSDYKKQTVVINDDLVIEIHKNPIIKNKLYHLRVYGHDGYCEYRLNQKDMLNLSECIIDFASQKTQELINNDKTLSNN
jgi:hypothetical protein